MQRILLGVFVAWLAIFAIACSTTNSSTTGLPDWDDRDTSFTVTTEDGSGTFKPVLDVTETAEGATVTVTAENAQELSSAFLHLSYNPGRYTPDRVEIGSFLGTDDQVISLAVTDVAGDVPVGVVQVGKSGITPVSGTGVLATVYFSAEPFVAARQISAAAPKGTGNIVDDLAIISQDSSTATLHWTEKNVGDYDNNSEVGIADLSPIALYYGDTVASSSDPEHARMVDGDKNGEVTLADITPIGQNFGSTINGYIVYTDGGESETVGEGITVLRNLQTVVFNRPVIYQFDAPIGAGSPQFAVRPAFAEQINAPGPPSNVALVVNEPGAPQDPSNLLAESGIDIGAMKIQLTWTASTSIDVGAYEIERKLSSDPDTSFVKINEVSGGSTTFTDQDGLSAVSYDYRVRARDLTTLTSGYTGIATAIPYVIVINPAQNPAAIPHPSVGTAIQLTWDSPLSPFYNLQYRVFQKGPADADFVMKSTILVINAAADTPTKRTFTATDLTEGQNYEFYIVVSHDGTDSVPSPTASSMCSEAGDITVTLELDKKTHFVGGGEGNSTITATPVPSADSYEWSASLGSVSGSGASVTWAPSGSPDPGVVTITCIAHKGSSEASSSVDIYLCEAAIMTQYGESGHFTEFSDKPSILQPSPTYRPFSFYADGESVVLFNWWETWCGPCLAELPTFDEWCTEYGADGFWYVGNNGDDSVAATDSFFSSRGWNQFESYNGVDVSLWQSYGFTGGIPTSILFDQDGFARAQQIGTITGATEAKWERIIAQCLGVPVE